MCNKQDHNDIFFLESDGTAFSYGIKYGIIRSTYSKSSSQSSVSVEWVPTQTTVLVHTKKMNKIHGDWEREKKLYMLQDWEELKVSTGALA